MQPPAFSLARKFQTWQIFAIMNNCEMSWRAQRRQLVPPIFSATIFGESASYMPRKARSWRQKVAVRTSMITSASRAKSADYSHNGLPGRSHANGTKINFAEPFIGTMLTRMVHPQIARRFAFLKYLATLNKTTRSVGQFA
jgi:hypothetical protein